MAGTVRFIRKNGKIIPIMAASAGAKKAGAAALKGAKGLQSGIRAASAAKGAVQHHQNKGDHGIKVNPFLDIGSLGLSIASGALAAATFTGSAKKFIGGAVATHAIDAVGISANAASVAGKGNTKERAKQFAKQEGRNLLVGNAVYAAGLVGIKKNRDALKGYAGLVLDLGRRALGVIKR